MARDPSPPPSELPSDTPRASSPSPSASLGPQQHHEPASGPGLPSFAARSRALSSVSSSPVKRKPLPVTASPLATRYVSVDHPRVTSPTAELGLSRRYTCDSPTLYDNPLPSVRRPPDRERPDRTETKELQRTSNEPAALTSPRSVATAQLETKERVAVADILRTNSPDFPDAHAVGPCHESIASVSVQGSLPASVGSWYEDFTSSDTSPVTMSIFSTRPTPPHLNLPDSVTSTDLSHDTSAFNNSSKPLPKSPSTSKLGSFFGWGGNSSPASSTTTFSDDKASSPAQSPVSPKKSPLKLPAAPKAKPAGIDVPRANAKRNSYFSDAYRIPPPTTPSTTVQVEEMEDELKAITAELATSIRREMELEDLVERLQSETANTHGPGKRTSDYFSDAGTSSFKYGGELEARSDELGRLQRQAEREKAQVRMELTAMVQDERTRRKALEEQIRSLEGKAVQAEYASTNPPDASGRLRELESTCEDLRRRLNEERTIKDNFEDLLAVLKDELQSSHNQRDNLRDEIVPQLRARVEGLEAQAAEYEKLTYEHTKMQQEMHVLREENTVLANAQKLQMEMQQQEMHVLREENTILANAQKLQMEMQQQVSKFNSIDEESMPSSPTSVELSRSNSVAQSLGLQRPVRPPSLMRSSSVRTGEPREMLAERLRDVELQRDALHRALKNLLERQDHSNRENAKRIRQLEIERDNALSSSPRRIGYDREVQNLREEINTLRRRADEAIEQKWSCEKGLSGLKMDLERAEQEIGSLRSLLQDNEIPIPGGPGKSGERKPRSNSATSEALQQSFENLQKSHAESLDRIKDLEEAALKDAETEEALARLQRSLSAAVNEREFARQEAESYRESSDSLRSNEKEHINTEIGLTEELRASAKRVEELASQVQRQLATNAELRQRLVETIDRGEKEQRANTSRILHMQGKLRSLEDDLMAAQQASEERIAKYEEEVSELKKGRTTQLLRLKDGIRSPRVLSLKGPRSPFLAGTRSPRLDVTTSGKAMSIGEESKIEFLKRRVVELEKALEEADSEMEAVVCKMNVAQIEVMELQNEREEAVRQTRKLQAMIEEEKLRNFQERFATLSS